MGRGQSGTLWYPSGRCGFCTDGLPYPTIQIYVRNEGQLFLTYKSTWSLVDRPCNTMFNAVQAMPEIRWGRCSPPASMLKHVRIGSNFATSRTGSSGSCCVRRLFGAKHWGIAGPESYTMAGSSIEFAVCSLCTCLMTPLRVTFKPLSHHVSKPTFPMDRFSWTLGSVSCTLLFSYHKQLYVVKIVIFCYLMM